MFPTVHTSVLQRGQGYSATSPSTLTIATGSISFTTQTLLAYSVGAYVRLVSSTSTSNFMEGTITAYNTATGLMTVNMTFTQGSGTFSSWNLNLCGFPGKTTATSIGAAGVIQYSDGAGGFSSDGGFTWSSAGHKLTVSTADAGQASILITRASGVADANDWELIHATDGSFHLRTVNDAYTTSSDAFIFTRSVEAVTALSIPIPNVGINTASTDSTFVVNGSSYLFNAGTNANTVLDIQGNGGHRWRICGESPTNGNSFFIGDSANNAYIQINGSSGLGFVGIGATPTENFQVKSTVNYGGFLISGSMDNIGLHISSSASSAAPDWNICSTGGTSAFGTGMLTFSLGAAHPLLALSAVDGHISVNGSGQSTSGFNTTTSGGIGGTVILEDQLGAAGDGGALIFAANTSWRFGAIKGWVTDGSGNSKGDIVFFTRRVATDATLTEAIRVTSSCLTGINNSAPGQMLEVSGTSYSTPANSGTSADASTRFSSSGHGEVLDIGVASGALWLQTRLSTNYATNYSLLLNPNGGNIGMFQPSPVAQLDVITTVPTWNPTNTTVNRNGILLTSGGSWNVGYEFEGGYQLTGYAAHVTIPSSAYPTGKTPPAGTTIPFLQYPAFAAEMACHAVNVNPVGCYSQVWFDLDVTAGCPGVGATALTLNTGTAASPSIQVAATGSLPNPSPNVLYIVIVDGANTEWCDASGYPDGTHIQIVNRGLFGSNIVDHAAGCAVYATPAASVWGANFAAYNNNNVYPVPAHIYGLEVNLACGAAMGTSYGPCDEATGVLISSTATAAPRHSWALNVTPLGSGVPWQYGIHLQDASCTHGAMFGSASSPGSAAASCDVVFNAYSAANTLKTTTLVADQFANFNLTLSGGLVQLAGINTTTLPTSGFQGVAFGWNTTGGQGEVDIYNTDRSSLPRSFGFYQMLSGGTSREVFRILSTGELVLSTNFYGAGTLQTDASGNVTASSDSRLKTITATFTRGLSDIVKITPQTYQWKKESGMDTERNYSGLVAQDIKEAIPEAIGQDGRGYLTVQDRPIIAALINAVKELSAKVDSLSKPA